jgi:hypothetical protein
LHLLCSKIKVCAYLERAFLAREKNKAGVFKLRMPDAWTNVAESFAVTMMRYHMAQPWMLKPFIRASEPAMTATQPWENMLWLGLAAPPEVFSLVRKAAHMRQHSA